MKILDPDSYTEDYFTRVAASGKRALLLDYDGTLAPFHILRDEAFPYPGVAALIDGLNKSTGNRLVIISGRPSRDVVPLLGLDSPPEIWGVHGWERLTQDGVLTVGDIGVRASEGLGKAFAWACEYGIGGSAERKSASVAVHWRGLEQADAESVRTAAQDRFDLIARESGLELHGFDGGVELRVPGRHKGMVVDELLADMGGDVAAAYLGDDLTDEDAFTAIKGRGLGVLVRDVFRDTSAGLWINPPGELLWFLRSWLEACGGG